VARRITSLWIGPQNESPPRGRSAIEWLLERARGTLLLNIREKFENGKPRGTDLLNNWEKIVTLTKPEPKDPLDAEREQMEAFASARLRWFQGRTGELEKLAAFVRCTDENAPRLAVVAAEPGQGKSALLAKHSPLISDDSSVLITHFVGATERSSSAHALVERLLSELDRSGIAWPTDQQEVKRDFNSLCLKLAQRLGDYANERAS
jgi:hypothetical protein